MNSLNLYFEEDSPKAEILQGAMEEFIEFGKKGARMQSIANRAGVNKALLHYYFTNKETLHKEVLRRVFRKGMSNISHSLEDSQDPPEQICELIRAYFHFISTSPELPRLMIHEISSNPEEVAELLNKMFSESFDYPGAILGIIRKGIERKQFREVDPRQFLVTVLSSIIFYFVAKPMFIRVLRIEDEQSFQRERVDHLIHVLMHGIERSP